MEAVFEYYNRQILLWNPCRYLPPFFKENNRIVYSKIELTKHANEINHPLIRESIKHAGIKRGVEIHHHGDVPGWSGMGTSSSFTVGLLRALYALKGQMVDKKDWLMMP